MMPCDGPASHPRWILLPCAQYYQDGSICTVIMTRAKCSLKMKQWTIYYFNYWYLRPLSGRVMKEKTCTSAAMLLKTVHILMAHFNNVYIRVIYAVTSIMLFSEKHSGNEEHFIEHSCTEYALHCFSLPMFTSPFISDLLFSVCSYLTVPMLS